ncbi:MAG: TadE family protein [Planctomycetota bacterium]|nr:TadE family protein [Planctomycetota bacterium]
MNISGKKSVRRRGIATSELAICLPIIILLTLGVLETCTVIFLKESITIGAYEGARVGIRKQGTNATATLRVTEFLDSRGIVYDSDFVSFSEPGFDDADDLEHVTVTVVVPCQGNTYTGWIFTGRSVSASVTMRKEFSNL